MLWDDRIRKHQLIAVTPRMRVAAIHALVDKHGMSWSDAVSAERQTHNSFRCNPSSYLLAVARVVPDWWDTETLYRTPSAAMQEFSGLETELRELQYKPPPSVFDGLGHTVRARYCNKCGSEMTLPGGRQLRAGDEGMTAIYRCSNKHCVQA